MNKVIDVSNGTSPHAYASTTVQRRGIVIHATAGRESLAWLQRPETDPKKKSSADWLISRDGTIRLIVPFGFYSFHSGAARWRGYQEKDGTISRGFIGIECENLNDGAEKFTNAMYVSLAGLVRWLMSNYPISPRDVCLHWECAIPEGRKSDPALFDWPVFTRELLHPSVDTPDFTGLIR